MIFRKSTPQDLPQILNLLTQAINQFKAQGSEQWQYGYPNQQVIQDDIKNGWGFVVEDKDTGKIITTVALVQEPIDVFAKIQGGKWFTQGENYLRIHRLIVEKELKGKGLAAFVVKNAEQICIDRKITSIRSDTYHKNLAAQRFFEKNGFKHCGYVVWLQGKLNPAYEKIIIPQ